MGVFLVLATDLSLHELQEGQERSWWCLQHTNDTQVAVASDTTLECYHSL